MTEATADSIVEEAKKRFGIRCNGRVPFGSFGRDRPCTRYAKFFEQETEFRRRGGRVAAGPFKGFCGLHAPSKREARQEKRDATRVMETDVRNQRYLKKLDEMTARVLACANRNEAKRLVLDIKAWGLYSGR